MKTTTLVALIALLFSLGASAAETHSHGTGKLDLIIDKGKLSIDMELPMDSVAGFERAPRNAKEKALLTEARRWLSDATALFIPTAQARCTLQSAKVSVPYSDGQPAHPDEHADVDASYVFQCAEPAALKGMETTLFKQTRGLYRLDVQRVGPVGQGAGRLSAKQPSLSW